MRAAEVSAALALRIDELVPTLLRDARKVGNEWEAGSYHGDLGRSLKVHSSGPKAGVCCDFATGQGGDALDLVALAKFDGDKSRAFRWGVVWLGYNAITPARNAMNSNEKPKFVKPSPQVSEIWKASAPGHLEASYLRSRGLTVPLSGCIRSHPACPRGQDRYPAMLALMTNPITNEPVGVHRTFLTPDGKRKADLEPNKMMLGSAGVIRLSCDEDVTRGLGICEGIETGIAIIQMAGWSPIWAAASANGIRGFPVLAGVECLTIFADHDCVKQDGSQPGLDAAGACAERWRATGREVVIRKPPLGMDWLDALGARI